ncbi:MAG: DUF3048 domain-containing protein, partial [Proteobacteria bacterium]|nr:DUF3048 domain-containing protein [Pseudomonadota bacterium]
MPALQTPLPDHYAALGLHRRCTADQIRTAYRLLAKQHHPDLNGGSAESLAQTRALNAAHEVLGDPERRAAYDRERASAETSNRPVRSARISDMDILAPFGKVAFSNSGAQSKLLPVIAAANLYDVSADKVYEAFTNDPGRPAPVDHMADPRMLLAAAPDAALARDVGFVFSEEPPAGGKPVKSVTMTWPSSEVSFTWDEEAGNFIVGLNGEESRSTEGGPQRAATVVIQSAVQTDSGYGDRYGGRTPFIETVGEGAALVLRDGRMWSVTWERPTMDDGTRFVLPDGTQMPFAIGQE